jgi:YebC/PmpR family DNA-binding regulatory protein
MSGHSKWATIKHKKAATDAKRGKLFTRVIKEISIAARSGGGDPDANPRLRTAILAAKAVSMPQENIKRAIERGTGELEGGQIDEVMYEGYGPGGTAILVEVATDNRNRTVSEIRHLFTKYAGKLGVEGSVSRLFTRKSQVLVPVENATEERLMDTALDAGVEDIRNDGVNWEILSPPEAHLPVLEALNKAGIQPAEAQVVMVPSILVKLEGKDAGTMIKLSEALEEHEDVQNVYANFDIDDKVMEALAQ